MTVIKVESTEADGTAGALESCQRTMVCVGCKSNAELFDRLSVLRLARACFESAKSSTSPVAAFDIRGLWRIFPNATCFEELFTQACFHQLTDN